MIQLRNDLIPLLIILGGIAFQLVHFSLLLRGSADPRTSRWWLVFGGTALAFVLARFVQRGALVPGLAVVAVRAQFAMGSMFTISAAAAVERAIGYPRTSKLVRGLLAVAVPIAVICLGTTWVLSDEAVVRVDALGSAYYATRPQATVLLVSAFYVAAAIVVLLRIRRLTPADVELRRVLRFGAIVFLGTGLNDSLMNGGLISSVHLFEYGFVAIAAVTAYYAQRHAEAQQRALEALVTERTASLEQALAEVRRGETRFRHLASAASEGILVCDGRRVLDTNQALHRMFGREAAELVGQDVATLVAPGDLATLLAIMDGEPTPTRELTGLRQGGERFPLEVNRAEEPDGSPGHRVLLLRDVAEQKEVQRKLLRADRMVAMGTLAAGTAHEINNPLTYVLSNAEMLDAELAAADGMEPGKLALTRELVADVITGAERVRLIVRDLMTLAREREPDDGPVDLPLVIDEALAIAGNQLRHRARVTREYEAGLPPVLGNQQRLGQVFLNLLVNAAQAIAEGHVDENEVRVVVRAAGAMVVAEIVDSGSGIRGDVRDRIFDPFFTTKDVGSGTGLGLSVSLGIVTALGGRIEAESEPGQGTRFTVWLPRAPGARIAPPPPTVVAPPVVRAGVRVLLVDDEPMVARAMARALTPLEVIVVHSGREALERCAAEGFDAIVCDLMMPDTTGMEVYGQLVRLRPELAARMVFVSGGVFTETGRAFLEQVARPCLTKPVAIGELRRAVDAVLST